MDIPFNENQENNPRRMRRNTNERKSVYRNLLNKIEGIDETQEVSLRTVNEIGDVLREANSLDSEWGIADRVEHAEETYLDSLVISSASFVLKKCIEAVDVFTSTYDPTEFSNHIINGIKDEEIDEMRPSDLLKLLDDARQIVPKVPEYSYIYGSYDLDNLPTPKPRKEKVKAPKEKFQKKEPEKVTNRSKDEETIEEIVNVLLEVLTQKYNENNEQPIKYYDYVIDTDDFGITVENMFYFSFLVRDGRASIDLNGKGEPIIKPVKKRAIKEFRDNGGVDAQIISVIDMENWAKFRKPGHLQHHKKKTASN